MRDRDIGIGPSTYRRAPAKVISGSDGLDLLHTSNLATMALFEWLIERRNPGSTGSIDSGAPGPAPYATGVILLRGAIGLAMMLVALYFLWRSHTGWGGATLFAIYLVLAYLFDVQPDYTNMGMMGGLIDHPFRYSDDMNRGLAVMRLLLWPGRFAVASVRDVFLRARGRRTMVFTRTVNHRSDEE